MNNTLDSEIRNWEHKHKYTWGPIWQHFYLILVMIQHNMENDANSRTEKIP